MPLGAGGTEMCRCAIAGGGHQMAHTGELQAGWGIRRGDTLILGKKSVGWVAEKYTGLVVSNEIGL